MEQISVIARRLKNGHVQYGWSSGDRREIGRRLMKYYRSSGQTAYLFDQGKARICGSEREIFNKKPEAGNAFFYEADGNWYDVLRGPFYMKTPLELVLYGLDKKGYSVEDYIGIMERGLIEYMLSEYLIQDEIFEDLVRRNCVDAGGLLKRILTQDHPMSALFEIKWLYHYFDRWAVIFADESGEKIAGYLLAPVKRRRRETVMR